MTKARFTTPTGRLVQGSVGEAQTKDATGQLRVVKTGPNAGQPNPQFFIAIAVAKTSPEWPAFKAAIMAKAAEDFPALFPQGPTGPCANPNFSDKIIDGDGVDQNGKSNATKEGFAGHWVIRLASGYAPRCFYKDRYDATEQIQEPGAAIKRGYFVKASGTMEGNGQTQNPGMYLNLDLVSLEGHGPEIVSGPDANEVFSSAPASVAPEGMQPLNVATGGATATPPATPPATTPPVTPPATPPATTPPVTPPATPPATTPPVTPPATPPAPHTEYMDPAVGPVMTEAANGATYEAMIAAGWTHEQLVQHGMIVS